MDEIYRFNQIRWSSLVKANALFTRPWLNETSESSLRRIDPDGHLGCLQNKDVLCLAAGGGQQSVVFALNGARVTVLDISEGKLSGDQEAADQYGYSISTEQGDMRNLSIFPSRSFDIVSHTLSISCRIVATFSGKSPAFSARMDCMRSGPPIRSLQV